MLIIDLFKDVGSESICISKKIGLYLNNYKKGEIYDYIKEIIEKNYKNSTENCKELRKKIIECFEDKYYKNEIKKDISKFNSRQLISLIAKKVLVLELEISEETIIVDDDIFEEYDDENIAKALRTNPLINPIDEYDIEYKMLFLFNFLGDNKNKRDDIDIIYYNGYSRDDFYDGKYIFNQFFNKTYIGRKEHKYWGYKYYKDSDKEYREKISSFIEFGQRVDKYIEGANDYFILDFIIETLIYAQNYMYSLLNYIQLIEMLIVNPKCSAREQFKQKLKLFIDDDEIKDKEQIEEFSTKLYDIRSRLIHGDYNALKKELIRFSKKFNSGMEYDYGEFKEENWIIMDISNRARHILRNILEVMLNDKKRLLKFKMDEISEI